jgi:transcriptional regulator with PAS, ATPase and Fis domain
VEEHEGVLARCSPHGAIFLDEIGEVAAPVQIKLLTVLQDRAFTPVGSHERRPFRGRVIAATNRPLAALRGPDGLRPDFFYRLCSDVIELPSLGQRMQARPSELGELMRLLTDRLTGPAPPTNWPPLVEKQLRQEPGRDYPWPGNVRELEQAVRRVLLTGRYTPPPAPAVAVDPAAALAGQLRAGELHGGAAGGRLLPAAARAARHLRGGGRPRAA